MSDSGLLDMISDLNKIISQLAHRAMLKEQRLRDAESQKLKLESVIRDKDEAIMYIFDRTLPKFKDCVQYTKECNIDVEATKKEWESRIVKKANASPPVAPPELSSPK